MLNRTLLSVPVIALAMAAGTCLAQNPEELKFYKLEFVLKEVEGAKVINSRSYSMQVSNEAKGPNSIRTGTRVPVSTSSTSVQILDVGVSIDCRFVKELQHSLTLFVTADISSVPAEASATPTVPAVRQNKWSSTVLVPIKKPTVIFTADDTTTKRQMQLELTATPIG
jgi:hypothetical protein